MSIVLLIAMWPLRITVYQCLHRFHNSKFRLDRLYLPYQHNSHQIAALFWHPWHPLIKIFDHLLDLRAELFVESVGVLISELKRMVGGWRGSPPEVGCGATRRCPRTPPRNPALLQGPEGCEMQRSREKMRRHVIVLFDTSALKSWIDDFKLNISTVSISKKLL